MTYQVTLSPSGHTFQTDGQEHLLESGLRQHIGLPYGCKSGVCGACKCTVLSGEITHSGAALQTLSDAERQQGLALLCCTSARSNLTVEVRVSQHTTDFPVRIMPTRVQAMNAAAEDVMILQLKLPANENFRFRPGQYIDILLKDGQRRSFSIANAPRNDSTVELHIRRVSGGLFTEHVFSSMQPRDILRIEGPLGSFFLQDSPNVPIILLAGGTGFAPIKAIVESLIEKKINCPVHLYWGANTPMGLYLDELAQQWAKTLPDFRYTPVVSNVILDKGTWSGRTGLVHQALMADYDDLSSHHVYACGAPGMIDAARKDLTQSRALPADAFFADAFTFSNASAEV